MRVGCPAALFVSLIVLPLCTRPVHDLGGLRSLFSRPEYISTGDGWAEARRRRLLASWLQNRGFKTRWESHIIPERPNDKYRHTSIFAEIGKNRSEQSDGARNSCRASLSLIKSDRSMPQQDFSLKQRHCDEVLFRLLAETGAGKSVCSEIEFSMDTVCFADRLTPQVAEQD